LFQPGGAECVSERRAQRDKIVAEVAVYNDGLS
jgi:hypothetical protein